MKPLFIIVAASAALSASLVAGLAAADVEHAPAVAKSWIDPPAKAAPAKAGSQAAEPGCREAAWPYRFVACGEKKVRVIETGAAPALLRLPNGAAPVFVSLPQR